MQTADQKVEPFATARKIIFLLLSLIFSILGFLLLDVTIPTIAYSFALAAVLFGIFFAFQRGKSAYGSRAGPGTYTRDILVSAGIMAVFAGAVFLLRGVYPNLLEWLKTNVWPILGPILFILFVSIYTTTIKGSD